VNLGGAAAISIMRWDQNKGGTSAYAGQRWQQHGRFAALAPEWDPAQAALLKLIARLSNGSQYHPRANSGTGKGKGKGNGPKDHGPRKSFPPAKHSAEEGADWKTSGPKKSKAGQACLLYEDGTKVKVRHEATHVWLDGAFACHGCQGMHHSHNRVDCAHCGMKRNKAKELKVIPNGKKPAMGGKANSQALKPGTKAKAAPKQEPMEIDSADGDATPGEEVAYTPAVLLNPKTLKKMILSDVPMAVARKGNLKTTSVVQRTAEIARLQAKVSLEEANPEVYMAADLAASVASLKALVAVEEPSEPQVLRNRGDMVLILGFHKSNMLKASTAHATQLEAIGESLRTLQAKKADLLATEAMRIQTDLLLEDQLTTVASEGENGALPCSGEAISLALPSAENLQPLLQLILATSFTDSSKYGCLPEVVQSISSDIMAELLGEVQGKGA
jgi:hypothetical protein